MSERQTNRHVLNKEGHRIGVRHVMYCRKTGMYVGGDCLHNTPSRVWAWSGTPAQAKRAREVFSIGPEFVLYPDGQEKNGA